MLTAVVTTPPVRAAVTCSAVTMPGAVLRLGRRGAQVRRHHDVVAGEDRVVGEGLLGEDVERRAGDLARLEALDQRVEVDQLAAGAVGDADAVAHLRDRVRVDEPDGLGRLRQVEADEVGAGEELVGALDALDAELAEALGGDELVVADHVHVEALGHLRDELADAAEPGDAEGLAVELGALELRAVPAALGQRLPAPGRRSGRARGRSPSCARRRRPSSPRGRWRR